MNDSIIQVMLDMQALNNLAVVYLKEGDTARKIVITLSDGGFPYEIGETCRAVFSATKPDGNVLFNHCTIEDNKIIYDVTQQTTSTVGKLNCEIRLVDGDNAVLTSASFLIVVGEAITDEDKTESSSEFSALKQLMNEVIKITQEEGAILMLHGATEQTLQEILEKLTGYKTASPTESTQKQMLKELEAQSTLLGLISKSQIGDFKQYADLRNVIRAGLASSYLTVGDQVIVPYAVENGSTYQAPWDVKHIAEDGVYLGMHYAIPDDMQFDAPEAIYYAKDGLAAGTYHIAVDATYGKGWAAGKNIQFTLASAVPAGGQVFIDCGTNQDNDPTAGRAVRTYGTVGGAEAIESTTTSSGTGGTSLGTMGTGNTPHKTNGQLNAISRVVCGNGRYSESAIRQWLNSEAGANSWWEAKNNWDRPPRTADLNRAGFLTRLPKEFVDILDYNDIVVALNTVEGYSTDRETVHDRIFLPSALNLNIDPQLANAEGPVWDYYKALSDALGIQKFAQWQTYEILKHYNLASAGGNLSPATVWLRSAYRSNANYAWYVNSSGNVNTYNACVALRGCPACKFKKLT